MHLADDFIRRDLQWIHFVIFFFFLSTLFEWNDQTKTTLVQFQTRECFKPAWQQSSEAASSTEITHFTSERRLYLLLSVCVDQFQWCICFKHHVRGVCGFECWMCVCVCVCEFHSLQHNVAEAQMKAVYLVSPEPVIFHSQLMGEIIRHVQFMSADRELPVSRRAPEILPENLDTCSSPAHALFILHQPPQHACIRLVSWPKSPWCMNSSSSLFVANPVTPVRDANEAIYEWWALCRTSDSVIMRGNVYRGADY